MYQVPLVLTAGELNNAVQVTIDSDNEWIFRGVSVPSTSALSTILARIQVNDMFLSNRRVPLGLYAVGGNRAKALETEILVRRGSTITMDVENSGGSTFRGSLLLVGVKFKEVPPNDGK
jgi:hypothetical protein